MEGRSGLRQWTLQHRRLPPGVAWNGLVALLVLIIGSSVALVVYWGSQFLRGTKLLMDAARIVGLVGVLLGGIFRGQLYRGWRRQRAARGGWKLILGQGTTETAVVRLQAAALQKVGGELPPQGAAADAWRRSADDRQRSGASCSWVTFHRRVGVKVVPNLCEVDEQWKAKIWWQPTDFAEFLRMRVLIGRAYIAVAKRRGVSVGSDFPAEPVLAHESRLGLNLGRQSRRERNRRRHVHSVLEEQAKQFAGTEGEQSAWNLDVKTLAKVAQKASKGDRSFAVEQARRHHEKTELEMEQQEEGSKVAERPLQRVWRRRRIQTVHSFPEDPLSLVRKSFTDQKPTTVESESSEAPSVMATPDLLNVHRRSPRRLATAPHPVVSAIAKALEEGRHASAASGAGAKCEGDTVAGPRLQNTVTRRKAWDGKQTVSLPSRPPVTPRKTPRTPSKTPRTPSSPRKTPRTPRPQEASTPTKAKSANSGASGSRESTPRVSGPGSPSVSELRQKIERQISEKIERQLSEDSERRMRQKGQRSRRTERAQTEKIQRVPSQKAERQPSGRRPKLERCPSDDLSSALSDGAEVAFVPRRLPRLGRRGSGNVPVTPRQGRRSSEPVVPPLNLLGLSPPTPPPLLAKRETWEQEQPSSQKRSPGGCGEKHSPRGWGEKRSPRHFGKKSRSPRESLEKQRSPRDWSLAAVPEAEISAADLPMERAGTEELMERAATEGSSPPWARQRSPLGFETRGFGLPREELERAGLSATGHLLRAQSDTSDDGARFHGAESSEDCNDAALAESSVEDEDEEDEDQDCEGDTGVPPLSPEH